MKKLLILLGLMLMVITISANDLNLVDVPTAGLLSRGEARIHQKVFKHNGMMIGTDVGLFDSFQFGVAYGAEELVGDNEIKWYDKVDFKAKLRIIEETQSMPAVAIGVDTQGHGVWHKGWDRYDIKSKGAYVVASKNFTMMGLFGIDFGVNYTFEEKDPDDENIDLFAGFYKTIGNAVTVYLDYAAGINDNYGKDYKEGHPQYGRHIYYIAGRGRGYLNSAVQLRINDQFTLKFLMHDMLKNKRETKLFDRSIVLDYRWFF